MERWEREKHPRYHSSFVKTFDTHAERPWRRYVREHGLLADGRHWKMIWLSHFIGGPLNVSLCRLSLWEYSYIQRKRFLLFFPEDLNLVAAPGRRGREWSWDVSPFSIWISTYPSCHYCGVALSKSFRAPSLPPAVFPSGGISVPRAAQGWGRSWWGSTRGWVWV